jgi:hypothetical protein
MESDDEEETYRCLMANSFDTERLVAEATDDEDDPDFEPGEEEEEEVSIAEFVEKRGVTRDCSANYARSPTAVIRIARLFGSHVCTR